MKKNQILIIVLGVICIIFLVSSIGFYLKSEYLEELYDNCRSFYSNDDREFNNQEYNNNTNNNDNNNSDSNNISSSDALQIALNSLNINKQDIYDLSNELEYKYGMQVYEIDFKYNGYEYDFYINAKTGEIIKSFRERD